MALAEWLEARARGRSAEQLREAVDSPKGVEGTAAAALALGFVEADGGRLTELGERFALGDEVDRRAMLARVTRDFAPYTAVFAALEARGSVAETEVRWIEALWATRGFGSSESNRREGAAAFGRFVDFAGLGEYVPGRRGRPTRIRWSARENGRQPPPPSTDSTSRRSPSAPDLFTLPEPSAAAPAPQPLHGGGPPPPEAAPSGGAPLLRRREITGGRTRPRGDVAVNRISVPLAGNAMARVEVPLRLPAAEKRRLLDLLELLITED